MKKVLALALVLVMIFALCACGTSRKGDPAVGDWTLTGLKMGDSDYSEYINMFNISLSFQDNGKGSMTSDGDKYSVTWGDGTFTDGHDTYSYVVEGDTLSFEAEGMTFIFTRS